MNLQLSLKRKWFELTKAGIKTEDYREINEYWVKRLMLYQKGNFKDMSKESMQELCNDLIKSNNSSDYTEELDYQLDNWYLSFKQFSTNTMTLGYPKLTDTERILKFEHGGIEIREGREDWGAEPGKLYFVIKHGKKIEND